MTPDPLRLGPVAARVLCVLDTSPGARNSIRSLRSALDDDGTPTEPTSTGAVRRAVLRLVEADFVSVESDASGSFFAATAKGHAAKSRALS